MSSLTQVLLDPTKRPAAVETLAGTVDAEVASKGGLGGAALKTAYAGAKKIKADLVPRALDKMLPEFAAKLDPFWQAKGEQPFGAYLTSRSGEAADSLLSVADAKANDPQYSKYAKFYTMVRPKAKGYVEEALPRVGTTIEGLMA